MLSLMFSSTKPVTIRRHTRLNQTCKIKTNRRTTVMQVDPASLQQSRFNAQILSRQLYRFVRRRVGEIDQIRSLHSVQRPRDDIPDMLAADPSHVDDSDVLSLLPDSRCEGPGREKEAWRVVVVREWPWAGWQQADLCAFYCVGELA